MQMLMYGNSGFFIGQPRNARHGVGGIAPLKMRACEEHSCKAQAGKYL